MHTYSINQQHSIRCRVKRPGPAEQFKRWMCQIQTLNWCLSIFLFIFFTFTPLWDHMSWVGSYHPDLGVGVRLLQPHQHAHSASGLTIHAPHQAPLPIPHQSLCRRYHSLPHSQSEPWHKDAKMMNGFFRTGNDSWRDTLPSLISKLIFHSPSSCHGHRALRWPVLALQPVLARSPSRCLFFSSQFLLVTLWMYTRLTFLHREDFQWVDANNSEMTLYNLLIWLYLYLNWEWLSERQSSELPRHHVLRSSTALLDIMIEVHISF